MRGMVIGLFGSKSKAQAVQQELTKAGLSRGDIHLASNESEFKRTTGAIEMSDEETRYYTDELKRGGAVVAAETTPDRAERVVRIMSDHKARIAGQARAEADREMVIPVIEEELRIGKRVIESGGVRIYSHVTERPVEEQVRLREERVHVERHPADRVATERDMGAFREGQIELTESVEEPVIAKEALVVEEVIVGKDVKEHTETIRDTVQRTDVEVERLQGVDGKRAPATPPPPRGQASAAAHSTPHLGGPIPNDLNRLKDLSNFEVADNEIDPRGWKLIGRDGDEIGKIDSLLASPSTHKAYFAIVDTGGWFQNKLFAIPLASINFNRSDKKAFGPYVKEQFKNAPEYRENDRNYQRTYDFWTRSGSGDAGAAGSRR